MRRGNFFPASYCSRMEIRAFRFGFGWAKTAFPGTSRHPSRFKRAVDERFARLCRLDFKIGRGHYQRDAVSGKGNRFIVDIVDGPPPKPMLRPSLQNMASAGPLSRVRKRHSVFLRSRPPSWNARQYSSAWEISFSCCGSDNAQTCLQRQEQAR